MVFGPHHKLEHLGHLLGVRDNAAKRSPKSSIGGVRFLVGVEVDAEGGVGLVDGLPLPDRVDFILDLEVVAGDNVDVVEPRVQDDGVPDGLVLKDGVGQLGLDFCPNKEAKTNQVAERL